jgi:O-antigen ligase
MSENSVVASAKPTAAPAGTEDAPTRRSRGQAGAAAGESESSLGRSDRTVPVHQAGETASGAPAAEQPGVVRERQVVAVIGVYALCLFIFPSDLILRAVGAQGFVAGLVALLMLAGWLSAVLLGAHDPSRHRNPARLAVVWLTVASLVCWALTTSHGLTSSQQLSADRWIMLVAASAGIVLVTAEGLSGVHALLAVLRLAVLGTTICAAVAIVQWLFTVDLSAVIRNALPGFSVNAGYDVYLARGALQRVTGTALHPIELGVVAGMMLPIAVVVAMHDRSRGAIRRWVPVVVIGLAIPASVSRAAVLTVVIALAALVLALPARPRLTAMVLLPVGGAVLSLARPGYLTTLASFVGAGSEDSSVAARLVDYPMVERLVAERPWFGGGGGTFLPANAFDILDNQYLKSAIEMGLVGMTGVLAWFCLPVFIALSARRRAVDPVLRLIAGALAGAALAAAVSSLTFDSLSFNMFAGVHALVVGCTGAAWLLARRQERSTPRAATSLPGS